ncbi:hypothetical protein BI347_19115 [Chromobacterium sphagni]|uniref:Uncharacterized protein n=1 Tax=Chromobacterium sphagni TaxID=1903179 RepID=A0A1S1WTX1_9NEIS|nr:hypothetical protein BI347_19115 [Chromobacterium sphagni]
MDRRGKHQMWLEKSRSPGAAFGLWQVDLLLEPSEMASIQGRTPVRFELPVLAGQMFDVVRPFRGVTDPFMTGRIVNGVWRAVIRTVSVEPESMSHVRRVLAQHINAGIRSRTKGREADLDG